MRHNIDPQKQYMIKSNRQWESPFSDGGITDFIGGTFGRNSTEGMASGCLFGMGWMPLLKKSIDESYGSKGIIIMKKTISLFLSLALVFSLCAASVFQIGAADVLEYVRVKGDTEIKVEHTDLTDEEIERVIGIAEQAKSGESDEYGISTCNVLCSVFGHKIKTSSVSITEHRVYDTYPRCLQEIYEVEICERCNYQDARLVRSVRVGCCE